MFPLTSNLLLLIFDDIKVNSEPPKLVKPCKIPKKIRLVFKYIFFVGILISFLIKIIFIIENKIITHATSKSISKLSKYL